MIEKLNILIIEDSIQDYFILKEYISRIDSFDAQLSHCESLSEAATVLSTSSFDIIFLDLFLSDSFGRNSFLKLKQIESFTPIIVLSGLSDKNIAIEIVQLGAQEYIVKGDFDELLIEKAIIYSIERYKFQKKIEASEKRHRLTFKNAGVALGEYNASELYQYVKQLKKDGVKSPKEIPMNTMDDAMRIRGMLIIEGINQEAIRLFRMKDINDFEKNYRKVHTEDSKIIFEKLLDAVWYEKDSYKVITKYYTSSHEELILLSRVTIYGYAEGYCKLIKSGTDITALVKKENLIARQKGLAESITNSSMALLSDSDTQLRDAMEIQADELGIDYMSLAKINGAKKGSRLSSVEKLNRIPEFISEAEWVYETPLTELGIVSNLRQLKQGQLIRVDSLDDIEAGDFKNALTQFKIKSLLVYPVFVKNEFWSAILMINFKEEKIWKEEEIITVKSFSNSIGSFIARKEAEQGIIDLNEQLESRIEKRTEDLTEAISELESFSYSVSHDLRAPLRKVGGFSQILEKEFGKDLPERANHLLNNIKDGATEMSQLIHDLLEFSKLGRQPISFSKISMTDLSEEIILGTRELYPKLNINFNYDALENAQGDRNLVKYAMTNLIWNAVKFSSKNEQIEIGISSERKSDLVFYSISDNGIGIDMNYAHKIFNVFQRLHTKDEYEGTGVGLAIVKRIVKKHGGEISVNGQLGEGTTFTFSLPSIQSNGSKKNTTDNLTAELLIE